MYKFPAFKLGSMVKSQNLALKFQTQWLLLLLMVLIKINLLELEDTTNTYPELETFFESDARVPDSRLDGLKKSLGSSNEEGHKVGNKTVMMIFNIKRR